MTAPHQRRLADVADTFLLGDALLVAPVTERGARRRVVALPPGNWVEWWHSRSSDTGDDAGERTVELRADRIPVFVRAGSIVALDDSWAEAGGPCALGGDDALGDGVKGPLALDHAPRLLAFHCWADAHHAHGAAFDDAGDGWGPVRRDELELSLSEHGTGAVLRWQRSGGYGAPDTVRVVLHGFEIGSAEADGVGVPCRSSAVECPPFDELRLSGLRAT